MAHGLKVYNTAGYLIIDQSFKTYVIMSEGRAASGQAPPAVGANQLLFVRPHQDGNAIYPTIGFATGLSSTSGHYDWAIVQYYPASPAQNWGLFVYGPNGELAFDSTRKPLNVVYSGQMTGANVTHYPPVTAGRRLFANASCFMVTGAALQASGNESIWYGSTISFSSGHISVNGLGYIGVSAPVQAAYVGGPPFSIAQIQGTG